jgi:hypothetical protein
MQDCNAAASAIAEQKRETICGEDGADYPRYGSASAICLPAGVCIARIDHAVSMVLLKPVGLFGQG